MRRHATTLTKLTEAEDRLKAEAAALAKKRAALARQREQMTRHAQIAQYIAVGQLVERMGLPIDDLGTLERTLKQALSTTAVCPTPPGKSDV